jgi:acetyltransferase-like isoleucine patch superfamily enzyme
MMDDESIEATRKVRMSMDGFARYPNDAMVHRTAVVSSWVTLGSGCIVHPFAVVGRIPSRSRALARQPAAAEYLEIGSRTEIGCHAVVFADVDIGADCLIGDFSLIREGAVIGSRCVIGCHASISYDSEISDDCRFQNGTVFHGSCGPGCFFGVGVICSSDRRVELGNYAHNGSDPPIIGSRVMVGSGANLVAGIKIGDNSLIGAGAVVTKDVDAGAVMLGPAAKPRANITHHPV